MNTVALYDSSLSGAVIWHTPDCPQTVRELIADNVGIWWQPPGADGVILLSDDWRVFFYAAQELTDVTDLYPDYIIVEAQVMTA